MEKYFRIVLLFCFLLYSEQHPVTSRQSPTRRRCLSLGLDDLKDEVKCDVTLTSPTNVTNHCLAAAVQTFEQELRNATKICIKNDPTARLNSTLRALERCTGSMFLEPHNSQTNATACAWKKKTFLEFVDDLATFKNTLNSV